MSAQCHEAVLAALGGAFTIKSVKVGFGHDRSGAMGNVFFNKKKAYEFHDDGWGGDSEIKFFDSELEQPILDFAKEKDIAGVLYANGWEFMEDPSEFSDNLILTNIAEALIYGYTMQKELKKRERATKANIVFGNDTSYRSYGFRGVSDLKDILKYGNGLKMLQEAYDKAKSSLGEGEKIYNSDEQLKGLGIKL